MTWLSNIIKWMFGGGNSFNDVTISIFSSIYVFINGFIKATLDQQTNSLISFVSTIAVSCIILYLLTQGYLIMSGRVENPINDVIYKLISLVVIMYFATDVGGWLNGLTDAIDGLRGMGLTDSSNPYVALDKILTDKFLLMNKIWKNANSPFLFELISIIAVFIGTLLFLVAMGIAIAINDITLKVLLSLAPLFIFCLSFQFIRGMFNNWLQLCFSNILYFVLLSLVLKAFINLDGIVKYNPDNTLAYGGMVIILGLFAKELIAIAKEISGSIASVSVEGLGAAVAGSLNRRMGYATGRGARYAARKGAQGAGYAVRKIDQGARYIEQKEAQGLRYVGQKGVQGALFVVQKSNLALNATMRAINKLKG